MDRDAAILEAGQTVVVRAWWKRGQEVECVVRQVYPSGALSVRELGSEHDKMAQKKDVVRTAED
jgi:hypothetical protein